MKDVGNLNIQQQQFKTCAAILFACYFSDEILNWAVFPIFFFFFFIFDFCCWLTF